MSKADRYYIDTNVVIAVVEGEATTRPEQRQFIIDLDAGRIEGLTSEITLAECLVKPIADRDVTKVRAYTNFLDGRPTFPLLPITRQILLAAAEFRAASGSKLPDAIHMATAQAGVCSVFLTNDRRVKPVQGVRLQFWDNLTATP